jgi:hypothetical protein
VTLRTPGPPETDPDTGNETPGAVVETPSRAYLAQRPVANLSSSIEDEAGRDTVTSLYTLLVPAGSPLTAKTTVVDEHGHQYEVEGDPAPRRGLARKVLFIAAALRRTSDLQEA